MLRGSRVVCAAAAASTTHGRPRSRGKGTRATATAAARRRGNFDVPRSVGGFVFHLLRPYLPPRWQYGWRWRSLQSTWLVGGGACLAYLVYVMYFKYTDEDIAQQAMQYTYVRNDRGDVVDISYKPLIDAAQRARRRTARILDPDEAD